MILSNLLYVIGTFTWLPVIWKPTTELHQKYDTD